MTGITLQAFSAWHGLIQEYSKQPLLPPTVCSIVEDMAIALPDLAQGEAPWSPLDDQPETSGKGTTLKLQLPSPPSQCTVLKQ